MKYIVNILNSKLETIKTIDAEDYEGAYKFAKNEAKWRGCFVEIVCEDHGVRMQSSIVRA